MHDKRFKDLLERFWLDFVSLFFPEQAKRISKVKFLPVDKELRSVRRNGIADLVLPAKIRNRKEVTLFLIEPQSKSDSRQFPRRLHFYYTELRRKYNLDVFPIALLTYNKPYKQASCALSEDVLGKTVRTFHYGVVQLNRLAWRDYSEVENPISVAFMSKMRMVKSEKAEVKFSCMRLLARLKLSDEDSRILISFVDAYIKLNAKEKRQYATFLDQTPPAEQEQIMNYTTSWEREGRRKGMREGRKKEAISLSLKLLEKRFGPLDESMASRITGLSQKTAESLILESMNFQSVEDLSTYLSDLGR